jgi:outer membrane immunogenic protein
MRLKLLAAAITVCAITVPAFAADLPNIKGPPSYVPPAQTYSWSGCYVGGDVGYAWGRDSDHEVATATGATSFFNPAGAATPNGVKVGGLLGCNLQVSGPFVLSIEGDGEWADLRGIADYTNTQIPPDFYQSRIDAEGSVRPRIGYAFNNVLFYATGGVAFAGITEHYVANGVTPSISSDISSTRTGWTVGGGLDYMIAPNWIASVEYRYSDFGTFRTSPAVFPAFTENHRITENAVRVGISYKFDWFAPPAPVVAKY